MRALLFIGIVAPVLSATSAAQDNPETPRPARNDVSKPGKELLILRHQRLRKGTHEAFYETSREGVWPWFEKIGTRIVGQWQVVHPDGGGSDDYDEGWRLARYASYEHWVATRTGTQLGGNGPDYQKNREALRKRGQDLLGSDHAYFLEGHMAPGGPYHLPGLEEEYEQLPGLEEEYESLSEGVTNNASESASVPVRNNVAQEGPEIVTLRYWKIKKGTFEDFFKESVEGVWPYFEKIGARVIGQWKVVHPSRSQTQDNPEFDEVLMMTRYASYEHWQASRQAIQLGGNGPDYKRLLDALAARRAISLETSLEFMQGYMYHSPPKYMPGLRERYRKK